MPERTQTGIAGHAFHAMNRCWPNELLFDTPDAYRAFIRLMAEVQTTTPIRILAYCLMPNHWHFILWPSLDGQLTKYIGALSQTHAKRLRKWRGTEGAGPVYPDRFLAVLLPAELNLYRALRYVERNPVRAGLSARVEEWRWSSASPGADSVVTLTPWPEGKPQNWLGFINEDERPHDLAALRGHLYAKRKSRPSRG
jgi:putative transposase